MRLRPPPPTTCSCPYTLLTQVMASPRMHRSGRPSDAYVVRQHRGRGRHRRRLLIGGEFNHQIPPDIEGIKGPWAQGPQRRRRAARKRCVETAKTDSIVQFATSAGVTIWNMFPGNYAGATPGPITAWRSPDGCTTTQIDYFVGDSEICRAWGVAEPAGRSDRSVVWTQIAPPVQRNKPKVAKPVTLKEWESAEAIAMTMFRTTLCGMTQDLGTTRNTATGAAAELTMRERAITQAAGGDATATTNCDRGQAEVPTRLAGHGEGSEPMQPHHRQENGATEGVPATSPRLAGRSGSMGATRGQHHAATGTTTSYTSRWLTDVRRHCSAKYSADSVEHSELVRALNEAVRSAGSTDPRADWRWEDTLAVRAALRSGKSTGHSAASVEVLQALPFEST